MFDVAEETADLFLYFSHLFPNLAVCLFFLRECFSLSLDLICLCSLSGLFFLSLCQTQTEQVNNIFSECQHVIFPINEREFKLRSRSFSFMHCP